MKVFRIFGLMMAVMGVLWFLSPSISSAADVCDGIAYAPRHTSSSCLRALQACQSPCKESKLQQCSAKLPFKVRADLGTNEADVKKSAILLLSHIYLGSSWALRIYMSDSSGLMIG